MARWLDFSGSPPGAATIAANGYVGVLRYIGLGGSWKHIQAAEYQDYVAHGLKVMLVAQGGTDDAWGSADDYAAGRNAAITAVNDARAKGIPDSVHIACAADAHAANQQQIDDCVRYAAGFASVLGRTRSGFYGFSETSQAVHASGSVGWHWRCGTVPSAADQAWVNFWQRNTAPTTVVLNGTTCDINEEYAPLEDILDPEERNALFSIYNAMFKNNTGAIEHVNQGDQSIISRLVELQQNVREHVATDANLTELSDEEFTKLAEAVEKEKSRRAK
jgi:glycoside hydrolase-like protein